MADENKAFYLRSVGAPTDTSISKLGNPKKDSDSATVMSTQREEFPHLSQANNGVMPPGLYFNRVQIMYENVKNWGPSERNPPSRVKVSLGLSTSIALIVYKCEVQDRTLLDHTIWRVEGEPITRVATEAVGMFGKIPRNQLDAVIDEMIPHALKQLAKDPFDTVRSKTFSAAYNLSRSEQNEKLLLTKALRIWATQKSFFNSHWRIVEGAETVNAPYCRSLGAALVPRMLALQLEQATESYMKELEQEFLQILEGMVFSRDPSLWLLVFLATFIYLSTLEGDTWDLEEWRARFGIPEVPESQRKFWPRETELSVHIDKNRYQADLITSHAKAVLSRGHPPFSTDSAKELVPTAGGDRELIAELGEEVGNSGHLLLSRQKASYSTANRKSLDYLFTSKLLVTYQ
ncbi:MAG: hypothetical protein M1813_009836 [Trichoglossum hirsutum]|nr:MAG: hypothetical protein M1813_009836 [Trichoglossum hirsutum]